MSVARLHQSLLELRATADLLEAGAAAPRAVPVEAASAPSRSLTQLDPRPTMKRVALVTLAHTVVCSTVVVAGFALVDPLLPRPDGPSLREPTSALDAAGFGAMPANAADLP